MSEDILLAEAVFAHNSKLRKGTKLSPFQLVKGKQSEPSPVDDTTEPSSTNRLKHLGVQAREKSEEVINQHTSLVSHSSELVVKGNSHQVFNSHHISLNHASVVSNNHTTNLSNLFQRKMKGEFFCVK